MKKQTKKMIGKVAKRIVRVLICSLIMISQILPVYASISASDGIGYVSKPEFNSVFADFNARISKFEIGLNTKIEATVNEYLNKIDVGGASGYVINNETEITGIKDDATGIYTNVTAIVGVDIAGLKIGDNVYVRDEASYNYWVSQINPTISLSVLNKNINNVIDNLTSTDTDKSLSANMGKKLNDEKQNDIFTNITGNAEQVLARNTTNSGLEFVDMISKQTIFDMIRPVHSKFIQYGTDDNPNTLFNGEGLSSTWEAWSLDGDYFRFDSSNPGITVTATAETDDHTLTIEEMPKHTHKPTNSNYSFHVFLTSETWTRGAAGTGNLYGRFTNTSNTQTSEEGNDQPHSHNLTNVHPKGYTAVLWERIS